VKRQVGWKVLRGKRGTPVGAPRTLTEKKDGRKGERNANFYQLEGRYPKIESIYQYPFPLIKGKYLYIPSESCVRKEVVDVCGRVYREEIGERQLHKILKGTREM